MPVCRPMVVFDHNAQTLRVVTSLEHRYPEFDGLNLTWESLEGIVERNGPLTEQDGRLPGAIATEAFPREFPNIAGYTTWNSGASPRWRRRSQRSPTTLPTTPTTSTMACAPGCLRSMILRIMPLTADMIAEIDQRYPGLDDDRRGAELVTRTHFLSYQRGRFGSAPAPGGSEAKVR